jgi:hypothetical protein
MANTYQLVQNMQTALTTGASPIFTATTCWYAFDPKAQLSNPPSDQFAVIQPTGLEVSERAWGDGAGLIRYLTTFRATVWVFVRLATDEGHREDLYLLDATYGSLVLADQIISLFQSYKVSDGATTYGYELDSVVWQTEDRNSIGWASTQLKYHSDLSGR